MPAAAEIRSGPAHSPGPAFRQGETQHAGLWRIVDSRQPGLGQGQALPLPGFRLVVQVRNSIP